MPLGGRAFYLWRAAAPLLGSRQFVECLIPMPRNAPRLGREIQCVVELVELRFELELFAPGFDCVAGEGVLEGLAPSAYSRSAGYSARWRSARDRERSRWGPSEHSPGAAWRAQSPKAEYCPEACSRTAGCCLGPRSRSAGKGAYSRSVAYPVPCSPSAECPAPYSQWATCSAPQLFRRSLLRPPPQPVNSEAQGPTQSPKRSAAPCGIHAAGKRNKSFSCLQKGMARATAIRV